jgi:shikimate dehydrogenase
MEAVDSLPGEGMARQETAREGPKRHSEPRPVPALDGHTRLLAHIGYPTGSFTAPRIYNPWFASIGCNAAVVPMGVQPQDFDAALPLILRMANVHGALITMPYKRAVLRHLDAISPAARIAGACNAVLRQPDGSLMGDMFDGEGFVRALRGKGCAVAGASALIIGAGGVGCAIAAALAAAGLARIALADDDAAAAEGLASRLATHHPGLAITLGLRDPAGHAIVVNATPLGTHAEDPLPLDPVRLTPGTFVGEVVLQRHMTPLLQQALARGCRVQPGIDMLYEQIPAYLAFFGLPVASAETLRAVANLHRDSTA